MFCKNCGAKLDDTAKFCPECGKSTQEPSAAPAANKKKLRNIAAIAVVVFILIGAVGFVLDDTPGASDIFTGVSIVSTVHNGQWKEVAHLYCNDYFESSIDSTGNYNPDAPGAFYYYNLGEQITENEYRTIQEKWFSYEDDEVQVIPMWYGNAQLPQTVQTIQSLANTADSNQKRTADTAVNALSVNSAISPFRDVAANAWYYNDVMGIVNAGIMKGKSADTFDPDGKITNAEVAQILANMHIEEAYDEYPHFADNPTDTWYASVVRAYGAYFPLHWDRHQGIAYFLPDMPIDRSDFAYTILRSFGYSDDEIVNEYLALGNEPLIGGEKSYPLCALEVAANKGIISGYANGDLGDSDDVSRAQCAAILNRTIDAAANGLV